MLGDSSSVLATTTTASGSRGGGGCGEASAPAPPPPPFSASHLGAAHHVVGSNNHSGHDQERYGGGGGGFDEGDRSSGGNRWPREETLTLLRIRSDMDVAFRDASVKGPLWEQVSRKLAEVGYNRSAKKCKEKFENAYKYHKRTKDGKTGIHEAKTYRFFDQLEAFHSHPPPPAPPKPKQPPPMSVANPPQPHPPAATSQIINSTVSSENVLDQGAINVLSVDLPSFSGDLVSNSTSSSSTSSDVEIEGRKKRKWKGFFDGLMKEVIQRQEEMQKRFLEAIEKREHERTVREESWRIQEMTRINREREILAQERSMASAKDAAVMAFLQKLSQQQNQPPVKPAARLPPAQLASTPTPAPPPAQSTSAPTPAPPQAVEAISTTPPPAPAPHQQELTPTTMPAAWEQEVRSGNNGEQLMTGASSSRWPKEEIEALIQLRTNLDSKYQENGPKGPLWEEISSGMRKLGYNRNSKRCKEKWENINKYYKKVKESNKKRPQDSKTCPYFHQLDALYRDKNATTGTSAAQFKPESSVPLMVRPEQQWPPPPAPPPPPHQQGSASDDNLESDQDDEDEAGGYEIVPTRQTSISSAG